MGKKKMLITTLQNSSINLHNFTKLNVNKNTTQYAHDLVLTSMWRRFTDMDVVWTSKRRRVLTGQVWI